MQKKLMTALSLLAAVFVVQAAPEKTQIMLADPTVARFDGKYYLLGTENAAISATPGVPASGRAIFPMYVSDDLTNWKLAATPLGDGRLLAKDEAFGKQHFWAPQLVARDGKYYLAYTSDFHMGLAVADRPEGPFRPYVEYPRQPGQMIDPFVLQDDDGKVYIFYSCCNVKGTAVCELSPDLRRFVGEPVRCVCNDQPWEHLPLEPKYEEINRKYNYGEWQRFCCGVGVTEGPTVIKRHGKYVLFYSANDFRSPDYCVGVAVADHPKGPWKKLQDAAVISRKVTGLGGSGHGDVFFDGDGAMWYVFHAHNSDIRVSPRRTGIIRLNETLGADGSPRYAADPSSLRLLKQ